MKSYNFRIGIYYAAFSVFFALTLFVFTVFRSPECTCTVNKVGLQFENSRQQRIVGNVAMFPAYWIVLDKS